MGQTEHKKELLEQLLRLRRAGRAVPGSSDLAEVEAFLEDELGETVSQRLAAEFLGVSHTALARWIARRDLPVVFTPEGRSGVPVASLLTLRESVEAERTSGRRSRHVLEPTMHAARRRASRLKPDSLVSDLPSRDGHRRAELRSLAYHRAVAQHLRREDVDDARQLLGKWLAQGRIDPRYAGPWQELLSKPLAFIKAAISADTDQMRDLRQNSPFAGLLSEAERERILQAVS
jgi:hypothetical protein